MSRIVIEVAAAIILQQDKVLLARRSNGKHLSGYWEFPGGKLNKGEEDCSCLIREIKEELDISIEVIDPFMNNEHTYGDKSILLKSYICKTINNQGITLKDHDAVEWVQVNDLLDYKLAPADIPIANALVNGKIEI